MIVLSAIMSVYYMRAIPGFYLGKGGFVLFKLPVFFKVIFSFLFVLVFIIQYISHSVIIKTQSKNACLQVFISPADKH